MSAKCVALFAEGVDRNLRNIKHMGGLTVSPSSRRAWIEIGWRSQMKQTSFVALLAEGVDRNTAAVGAS